MREMNVREDLLHNDRTRLDNQSWWFHKHVIMLKGNYRSMRRALR